MLDGSEHVQCLHVMCAPCVLCMMQNIPASSTTPTPTAKATEPTETNADKKNEAGATECTGEFRCQVLHVRRVFFACKLSNDQRITKPKPTKNCETTFSKISKSKMHKNAAKNRRPLSLLSGFFCFYVLCVLVSSITVEKAKQMKFLANFRRINSMYSTATVTTNQQVYEYQEVIWQKN